VNICLLNTLQGVVGGENQLMLVGTARPVMNLRRFGGALVMGFTAVNMQHSNVGDKLKILGRQLLCQQDAGAAHYNGLGGIRLKLTQSISNTHKSLARTSGHNHLPPGILKQSIQSTLLVRSELDHRSHRVWNYYSRKPPLVRPSGRFLNWIRL